MSKDKNEMMETEKLAKIIHLGRQMSRLTLLEKVFLERTFDAKVWKSGNSLVITVPLPTIERFKIKEGDLLEITIRK